MGLRLGTRLASFEMTSDDDAVDLYAPPGCAAAPSPVSGPR